MIYQGRLLQGRSTGEAASRADWRYQRQEASCWMSRFTNLSNRIHNHTFSLTNLLFFKINVLFIFFGSNTSIRLIHPPLDSSFHLLHFAACCHHSSITVSMHPHTLLRRHLPNMSPRLPQIFIPGSLRSIVFISSCLNFEGSQLILLSSLHPPYFLLTSTSFPPYILLISSLLLPHFLLTSSSFPPYTLLPFSHPPAFLPYGKKFVFLIENLNEIVPKLIFQWGLGPEPHWESRTSSRTSSIVINMNNTTWSTFLVDSAFSTEQIFPDLKVLPLLYLFSSETSVNSDMRAIK